MASNKQKSDSVQTESDNLEEIHRTLFTHPDMKSWESVKSLAQPSFLKQVSTSGGSHSRTIIETLANSKE